MGHQPNVLLISVDSLRADFCSFLGEYKGTTPKIEALANRATTFTHAISPSTWTYPVHASVFTGLYPPEHGLNEEDQKLTTQHRTLAELLNEEGYHSHSFGFNGWLELGDLLRGFEHHRTPKSSDNSLMSKLRRNTFTQPWRDEKTIELVQRKLQEDTDSPFCYFVHLNGVHYPYRPTRVHLDEFVVEPLSLVLHARKQRKVFQNRPQIYAGRLHPSEATVEAMKDLYRGSIHQADDLVGELIDSLRTSDLLDETVIVIFGDHGDSFGEGGVFGHQYSTHDSLIRVPLVLYDPTETLSSGYIDEVVQTNDLYPTISAICGVTPPETRSADLARSTRESAYVYYSAPKSFADHVDAEVGSANTLPEKQYTVWQSPKSRLTWYPDESRYRGKGEIDTDLGDNLMNHYKSLQNFDSQKTKQVSEEVRDNLRKMGYL